ncbi:hypothetical protein O6H91_20G038500 [Diphasiastrum complanatum]|uniref:Uncharacterized protein n=1 Tax=Diphasiastrum complanatum TaxID=34168 RepID=A0ACC2API2_DIPCM|nr:hypothetical protein O6H91_20G038500 [Diphasiastrum complanatum]
MYTADPHKASLKVTLALAYQSLGIVYGDLSISPLYTYQSAFSGKFHLQEDDTEILGVLSFVLYTITIIAVIKYIFIVLNADHDGEGGTFALYSLLCRHANLSMLPNKQAMDEELLKYNLDKPKQTRRALYLKNLLENHENLRTSLLLIVLLATCMLIADGVLTPAISVFSAVSGLKVAAKHLDERVMHLVVSIILIGLFALQRCGTQRVAFVFAPVVIAWLLCLSSVGMYNILRWNPSIFQALSPVHMFKFLHVTGKEGWASLGGILLCITGSEAMFADLGHFSASSIKIAFACGVYPSLILAYMGHAAYLTKHRSDIERSFYKSIPRTVFWPVFVIATLASIVGSQAVISATFSIIKQCMGLGCFPRVKVVHTSENVYGQIYIPEVNWMLLILCLAVTFGFRDTILLGNAYGLAVISVMFVTTFLMSLVMVIVWHWSLFLAVCFFLFFGSIEMMYLSAAMFKIPQGGWVPLVLSFVFMGITYSWYYGAAKKYEVDSQNKVSMKWLISMDRSLGIVRVPGIGMFYSELVTGVPAIFSHFVTNLPAFHQIVVFVTVTSVQVPHLPMRERYLVGRIGPKEHRMYRCVVRNGYKDTHKDDYDFADRVILSIVEFIQIEGAEACINTSADENLFMISTQSSTNIVRSVSDVEALEAQSVDSCCDKHSFTANPVALQNSASPPQTTKKVRFELPKTSQVDPNTKKELKELFQAKDAGVAYVLGHSYVHATKSSSLFKKFAINVMYSFLRKNCRGPEVVLSIPHTCLMEVGMMYYI